MPAFAGMTFRVETQMAGHVPAIFVSLPVMPAQAGIQ
jgi:hypothetical protein